MQVVLLQLLLLHVTNVLCVINTIHVYSVASSFRAVKYKFHIFFIFFNSSPNYFITWKSIMKQSKYLIYKKSLDILVQMVSSSRFQLHVSALLVTSASPTWRTPRAGTTSFSILPPLLSAPPLSLISNNNSSSNSVNVSYSINWFMICNFNHHINVTGNRQ